MPQQQAMPQMPQAYGMPQVQQTMPQMPQFSPLATQPSTDMFVPAPVPADLTSPSAMSPASTSLQSPDASKGFEVPGSSPSSQPKQKSMLPRLALLAALGLGGVWGYNQFFRKPKDPTADAVTPESPLSEPAKSFLQGMDQDAINSKTETEFLSKLKEHNNDLTEEERLPTDKLKENAIKTLKEIVESEDESMKASAQKLVDLMEGTADKLPQVASSEDAKPEVAKAEEKTEAKSEVKAETEEKKA
jgi:hypothetical protein